MSKVTPLDASALLVRFHEVDKKALGLTTFAAIVVVYIIGKCFYNRFLHPLRHFPGPVAASITEFALPWTFFFGVAEHLVDEKRHARYGAIFRKAPNLLQIADPELLPLFYYRGVHKPKRVYMSQAWGVGDTPTLINNLSPKSHAIARKRVAPAFTSSAVKRMQPLIQRRVDLWIEKSRKYADEGTAVNWSKWTQSLAYDVVSELVFGEPIGFVEKQADVYGLLQQFKDATPYIGILARLPWLTEAIWNSPFRNILKPPVDSALGIVMSVRDRLLQERLEKPCDKPDILSLLLKAENEDGTPISHDLLKSEAFIVMAAGSETTFSALCSFTINMIQNPRVYSKILATDLSPENLAKEEPQYPYLNLAIKETLRLVHPAPTLFPRLVGQGGVTLKDGRFIPEGTEVAMSPYCTLRDKRIFGPDADEFRPERWTDGPPEKLALMEKYNQTWGYGANVCIGRLVAEFELMTAMRDMLLNFVPEFADPEKPWDHVSNYGSIVYEGLSVRLRHRVQPA